MSRRVRAGTRYAAAVGAAAGVFFLDLATDLGVATGVLYVPVLCLVALARNVAHLWVATGLCTVLTIVGTMLSPAGNDLSYVVINRLASFVAIWATAIMAVRNLRLLESEERLRELLGANVGHLERDQRVSHERHAEQLRRVRVMASVMQDLKHEQRKLREQIEIRRRTERDNARLAAMLEGSNDAIVGIDFDGVITSWNHGAERLYGFSSDEATGRPASLIEGERDGRIFESLARVKLGEPVADFETIHAREDGTPVDVSVRISPIPSDEGEIVGASAIARDVTDRKRSDQLVRLAVEATPDGMLMVNGDGRIVMVNTKIEEIFGYAREALIGAPVERLIPTRFREEHPAMFAEFVRSPSARAMGRGRDLAGLTSDGRELPIEIGLTPVETDRGLHVLAAVVDITERTKMIAELRAKSAEMEQLLYVVSHDLKSPLVTVSGFAGIMSRHLEAGDTDKARDAAARIHRGATTMSRLIDDLLELSRVGSRQLTFEPTPLASVIDEVVEALEASLDQAGARVERRHPLPSVYADRSQLFRVMLNLVGNAIKYGCAGPTNVIRVHTETQPREIRICVADDGPGIDPRHHRRIFQLFQRLSAETDGTGLGLATVAKIMERHGGRVWVESEPGAGASFWLAFPDHGPQRIDTSETTATGAQGS